MDVGQPHAINNYPDPNNDILFDLDFDMSESDVSTSQWTPPLTQLTETPGYLPVDRNLIVIDSEQKTNALDSQMNVAPAALYGEATTLWADGIIDSILADTDDRASPIPQARVELQKGSVQYAMPSTNQVNNGMRGSATIILDNVHAHVAQDVINKMVEVGYGLDLTIRLVNTN